PLGAFCDTDDEPVAVLGYVTADKKLAIVGTLINNVIVTLRSAEFVEVKLLEFARAFQLFAFYSVRKTVVVETRVVVEPRNAALTIRFECVRQHLARFHIHHSPLGSIRSCDRDAVRPELSVVGE